jgi:tetratricopeptide (TPR) repeat protein
LNPDQANQWLSRSVKCDQTAGESPIGISPDLLYALHNLKGHDFPIFDALCDLCSRLFPSAEFEQVSRPVADRLCREAKPLAPTQAGQVWIPTARVVPGLGREVGTLVRISVRTDPAATSSITFSGTVAARIDRLLGEEARRLSAVATDALDVASAVLGEKGLAAVWDLDPIDEGVRGSSFGLGLVLAILSSRLCRPLPQGLVVTGTINLKEDVGSVGSISEKINAALWKGGRHFLLPHENANQADQSPHRSNGLGRARLNLYTVSTVSDAWSVAFPKLRQPRDVVIAAPSLPPPCEAFIGREVLRKQVLERISNGGLVVLWGEGGMGKTALALQSIHDAILQGTLAPGVAWITCEDAPGYEECVRRMSHGLFGKRFDTEEVLELSDRVDTYLLEHPTLVVLDNFETVAGCEDLQKWLAQVRHPRRVLLTTRQVLPGMPEPIEVRQLSPDEAGMLFVRCAGMEPNGGVQDDVAALCAGVANHPLALVLLAAHASGGTSLRRLLEEVNRGLEVLAAERPWSLPVRHQSIEACFRMTYQKLSTVARSLLRQSSVLPDGISEDVLSLISLTGGWERPARELVRMSVWRHASGRYTMHPLVRQFVLGKLGSQKVRTHRSTARALIDVAREKALLAEPGSPPWQMVAALDWMDTEWHNLVACGRIAAEQGDVESIGILSDCIRDFSFTRGHWHEVEEIHQQALDLRRAAEDQGGIGRTLDNLGLAYQCRGKQNEAKSAYSASLAALRDVGDRIGEARALCALGFVYFDLGHEEQGLAAARKSLKISRQIHDFLREGIVRNNMGEMYFRQRRFDEARAEFQKSLGLRRLAGDAVGEAYTLWHLGILYRENRQWQQAEATLQSSLAVFRNAGDHVGETAVTTDLAICFRDQERWTDAETAFQDTLRRRRAAADWVGEADALADLADGYARQGRWVQVEETCRLALELRRKVGDRRAESAELERLADALGAQWRWAETTPFYQRRLAIARESGDLPAAIRCLHRLGLSFCYQQRYRDAEQTLQEGIALTRQVNDRQGEGIMRNHLGIVYRSQRDWARAEKEFEEGLEILHTCDPIGHAHTVVNLGILHRNQRRFPEAEASFNQGLAVFRSLNDRNGEIACLSGLAYLHRILRQWDHAESMLDQRARLVLGSSDLGERERSFTDLGCLERDAGRWVEAEKFLQQGLAISRQLKDRIREAVVFYYLGTVHLVADMCEEAESEFRQALIIRREAGNAREVGQILVLLGRVYVRQCRFAEARAALEESLRICQEYGDPSQEGDTHHVYAELYAAEGNQAAALRSAYRAVRVLELVEDTRKLDAARELFHRLNPGNQSSATPA